MAYTVSDFAQSLLPLACRIRNTPNLIFLCGGKIASFGAVHGSARDYFYRHLKAHAPGLAKRVKLAEEVNAWFRSDVFPDLLELEAYLADLSDITILFVESPGSIAELGAFAASDTLRPRTLAVPTSRFDSERSFISDGPVRKLRNESDSLIHTYSWDPSHLQSTDAVAELAYMAGQLVTLLQARQSTRRKEQRFDPRRPGHCLLLVSDLVRIAGIITVTDLREVLEAFNCQPDRPVVDRYLSLLESLGFINKTHYGTQVFYVQGQATPFIRYNFKGDAPIKDVARIGRAIRDALEPNPRRALTAALKKERR